MIGQALGIATMKSGYIYVPDFTDAMIMTFDTANCDGPWIWLPTYGNDEYSGEYDSYIDWGDGSISHVIGEDPDTFHVYSEHGEYTIRIVGTYPAFSQLHNTLAPGVTEIVTWGDIGLINMDKGFDSAINLTSLPNEPLPSSLESCENLLLGCTGITTVPVNLFANNISTLNISYIFEGSGMTSIPSTLFDPLTGMTIADGIFKDCISLQTIPTGLFSLNVNIEIFKYVFYGCSSLQTIPSGFFNEFAVLQNIKSSFENCTSLLTLPVELLKFTTSEYILDFTKLFKGCTNLQLNRNIFYADGEQGIRFVGKFLVFDETFTRDTYTGIQGEAPDLWNVTGTIAIGNTNAFTGTGNSLTSLSNYASIPTAWTT